MTKILVISRVFPPQVGGSGRWLWELYSRFPEGECTVATRASDEGSRFDESHRLPIVRMGMQNESLGFLNWCGAAEYFRLYRELKRLAEDRSIQQVHAGCVLPEGFLAWMLRRRLCLPYSVYVHGEELNIVAQSCELTWMACRVLRSAEHIIANSQNTANLLHKDWRLDDGRVQILRPGVDASVYVPCDRNFEARRRLGWGDRSVVLTVGRLQARKGQDHMIRAIADVRKAIPNVLYSIVGGGEDHARLAGLINELGLQDYAILQGELREDELIHAYQQCDLFALPNREVHGDIEGFGLVLLEAQACGRPVFTGDSGGTREAVSAGQSGVVIDCGAPDRIADVVIGLLNDRDRLDEMGALGRAWASENFDWPVCVERAREVFGLPALPTHCEPVKV